MVTPISRYIHQLTIVSLRLLGQLGFVDLVFSISHDEDDQEALDGGQGGQEMLEADIRCHWWVTVLTTTGLVQALQQLHWPYKMEPPLAATHHSRLLYHRHHTTNTGQIQFLTSLPFFFLIQNEMYFFQVSVILFVLEFSIFQL